MAEPIYLGERSNKTDTSSQEAGATARQFISSTEGILRELLRASASSPIIAAATIVILSDILANSKVISETARTNLNNFIIALTAITTLEGVFKSAVQTLVYAEGGGLVEGGLGAVLGSAAKK